MDLPRDLHSVLVQDSPLGLRMSNVLQAEVLPGGFGILGGVRRHIQRRLARLLLVILPGLGGSFGFVREFKHKTVKNYTDIDGLNQSNNCLLARWFIIY